ncbi:MAG: hypothetical protein R3C16_02510 [Hyphomonadaceae bacterium]
MCAGSGAPWSASPLALFARVALPLARPGIAAGGALALMEIAADYSRAALRPDHATAVFRAWYAHGSPHSALQIAAVLLVGARVPRGRTPRAAAYGCAGGSTRWRPLPYRLSATAEELGASYSALRRLSPSAHCCRGGRDHRRRARRYSGFWRVKRRSQSAAWAARWRSAR